jgi:TRAP-type mannitol/chloroaromatic compound transport system substrate-binding protein
MEFKIVEKLKVNSDGKINLRFYEPNTIVPNQELYTAVGQGQLDTAFGMPAYYSMKVPAVNFFGAVPFGPGFLEFSIWMRYGGGQNLKKRIYGQIGIVPIECSMFAPETAGWFKQRFSKIDELKGQKMRIAGLGAKVLKKLGVKTRLLSVPDTLPALKKGIIDAAEITSPDRDINFGFHKITKYNYYPSWFQQTGPGELILNKKIWEGLSKTAQSIINTTCDQIYFATAVRTNAIQPKAMRQLKQGGAEFVTLRDSELDKLRKAWHEVAEEESAKDPLFAEVYKSYKSFRDQYAIWGDRAYLK